MKLTVKIEGIRELRARFKDPALIREPLHDLFTDAAETGRQAMESGIDGGLGIAVKSINANVQRDNAIVYSMLPKARGMSIEEGRRPGEDVPFLAIARWHKSTRHVGELSHDERETIFAIRSSIRAAGTKGKRFLKAARDAITEAAPGLIEKMARAVEERWEAGRR